MKFLSFFNPTGWEREKCNKLVFELKDGFKNYFVIKMKGNKYSMVDRL